MSRTKHHQKYGKNYSTKKYFTVYVGMSWCSHFPYICSNGKKPKLKKNYFNSDDHWFKSTPSWWVREFMSVPKRQKCKNWERNTAKLIDIEDADICPDFGNKPHIYYF